MTFPTVGVVGGGQLARMMAPVAINLGVKLHVLAEAEDVSATTAATFTVGDYKDYDTLAAFADDVDVITFDHEHVPTEHLQRLQEAGVALAPGPGALVYAQDKLVMRAKMAELGLPQPAWRSVASVDELLTAGEEIGFPVVLKTPRGGYDGKGVWVLDSADEARQTHDWFDGDHSALLVEAKVDFRSELSAQIARSTTGETATYPVVETIQTDGVADIVKAPAPQLDATTDHAARSAAETIAEGVGVTGMLAVELFHTPDTDAGFMINELAMRPHNTGHWTQDGALTSQFEQHLRAVLGLPLGATDPVAPYTVMKNYLGAENHDLYGAFPLAMQKYPAAKIHAYGKSVRPGRKIGHVNVLATDGDLDAALSAAIDTAEIIRHGRTDYAR
ncbi:MAG: 5-(carboxyamino)imidazole ribonucleotide synthase [Yaniella sp.]|uniref:5-(carboxyamino)imidazole ribonucleotide synthase n=1 Tax=Yaniella sp. TaxID=2773929 RepID=UPI002648D73A|nr:5-(carboxyamino)imidazole ribonucleotide synthase [Yaniella sp.]MDN5704560.1 5-(carboxyamino)imidazole ribonucleotide synthase [Yaniella sp.]MDN5731380.1 5-(carboxyamino)imidazole ribonucleotide synthase [Yaniella sp.]MDN5814885.1 5-(carboxyamino)imidazole ribonucleotide synthase [Yaniella sp.]MDN5817455.1 5-(carboxyamino)imidazole ribonucleotide synthase [Yaniella sp.]MDN5837706.1 5-(carboxyamino)imidazole ribonucleotide synthase [Yaniella sp.]